MSSEELSDDEIIATIEETLAEELNIHPSDIEVIFDVSSGEVIYTITSEDAESLNDIISTMQEEGFDDVISAADSIVVDSFEAPSEMIATIDVIVDASNVEDVESALTGATDSIQTRDPSASVTGEGNYCHQ